MGHIQGVFPHIWGFSEKSIPSGVRVLKKPIKVFREHHQQISNVFTYKNSLELLIVSVQFEKIFPGLRPEPQIYTE